MKSHKDIFDESGGVNLTYSELLTLTEWKDKRKEIISRENNTCQECNTHCVDDYITKVIGWKDPKVIFIPANYLIEEKIKHLKHPSTGDEILGTYTVPQLTLKEDKDPHFAHIHHSYYILDTLPWNYPNETLILLCHKCHTKVHETEVIPIYKNKLMLDRCSLTPCDRCGGIGHLPEFNHVQGGICFKCYGACFIEWL